MRSPYCRERIPFLRLTEAGMLEKESQNR